MRALDCRPSEIGAASALPLPATPSTRTLPARTEMPSASSNKRLYGEVNDEPASAKRSRLSGSGGTAATTVSGLPPTLRAPTCAAPVPNTSRLDSEARAGAHLVGNVQP